MSILFFGILLFAAAIISLGLTSVGQALAGELPQQKRTKQMVEGLYSNNLDAASYFQQGLTRYNRSDFHAAEVAFRKALQFDPFIAMAYYLLGNSLLQRGGAARAAGRGGRARRREPGGPGADY